LRAEVGELRENQRRILEELMALRQEVNGRERREGRWENERERER
jgi:hypothetical protein